MGTANNSNPLSAPEPADTIQAPNDRIREILSRYSGQQLSVAQLLCDGFNPSKIAFRIIGSDLEADVLSYGELRDASEKFAAALHDLDVRPGDRVATLMGKGRDYLIALMGIWRLGAVHVPLFTAFAAPQIAFRLTNSNTKLVLCDASQSAKLEPGADIPADAGWRVVTTGVPSEGQLQFHTILTAQNAGFPAYVSNDRHPMIQLYTSGTTGTPKGVVMPVKSLASFHAYMEFAIDIREDDVFWSAADPGWAYGLFTAIFGTLTTGANSILLAAPFSPETTFGALSKYGVTNFTAAPTVYRALKASAMQVPDNLQLRCASAAGEPLTPDVNDWAKEALGVQVHDHYGQTEMGMMVNNHHHSTLQKPIRPGSMGISLPGFSAQILKADADEPAPPKEVGRLAMDLQHSVLYWFDGYADNPGKTAEKFTPDSRYYITGDIAEMDEDGFIFFSSRDDDVIIMAGYRIGPFEVESTLSRHPAVIESAAVARPDEIRGEILEAFVVLERDYQASEELTQELQNFVKENFAAHAYPRRIHFCDGLPKTPSGKVQRFLLRKQLLEEASQ